MICKHCGATFSSTDKFCSYCGCSTEMVMNSSHSSDNFSTSDSSGNSSVPNSNSSQSLKKNSSKKKGIFIFLGILFVSFIILSFFGFFAYFFSQDKMICNSPQGNITLMFNHKDLIGYTARGITYDFDQQKEIAKEVGIESYLIEFNSWFQKNTSGSCTINGVGVDQYFGHNDSDSDLDSKSSSSLVVGDSVYGYVTVPDDWSRFYDVDGNNSFQYSYANTFIVSLNSLEKQYSAKEYASNFMYKMQNSSEVTDVNGATVTIGKNKQYTAYQVYMYYPSLSIYLITYWFEAEDNKVHYISLEGPGDLNGKGINDFLFIPESFQLTK